ncbi:MAG: hypothetical protein HZB38_07435, partial [Planctomycetes bacterium]|nr:hypothetical protein [Planctomycetota bacterium]
MRTPARAAFLLALVLRLGWVTWYSNQQGASLKWPDESVHWQIAHNLVYHGQLATDDGRLAQRMPLYPLFLAPFAAVGELGIPLARVAQAILASIMAFLGARLAQRAVSVWAGWLVGLLIACDPFSIYFSGMLLSETSFSLIAIGLIACAWHTSLRLRFSAIIAGEGHRLPASRGSLIVALLTAPL